MPEVIPGIILKGIPASYSAVASSPPRPKTKGSPPFSLRTRLFFLARCINLREISTCFGEGFPPRFPANSRAADGFASFKISLLTKAS